MGSLLSRVFLVFCASLAFVMTGCAAQQQLSGHRSYPFVVVGYFAEWGIYTADYTLADVPADRLTHLIYSFAKIEDGRIAIVDPQAALHFEMPADRPESWPAGQLAQLRTLRERNPHLKVMVALGGWTLSANFSDAVLDDSSRKRLAASIVTFLREHSLDGVDLDWEYPVAGGLPDNVNRPEDKENYVKFVRILRSLLNEYRTTRGERYLITVATPAPDNYLRNFDLRAMAAYVDWFNIMAYDYEGAWSPQTGHLAPLLSRDGRPSVASTVQAHLKQGVGKHQLVLGVPLYARAWNGVSAVDHGLFQPARGPFEGGEEPGFINYGTLMRRHLSDPEAYRVHSDSKSGADFIFNEALQGGSWFSFETPRTFRNKLSWARGKPLRGIMFWSLEGDLRTPGHSLSLLQQLPVQSRALQPETDD
ncbi:MAG: glycoside hydrolase family 18 protein [Verrucomicrobia bacterium]|nr:glycoside hydrolase family 18 protein [Verrucomicrobiota bacterium]